MRKRMALAGMVGIAAVFASWTPAESAAGTEGFLLGLDFGTSHIGADDPSADDPAASVYVDETGGGASLLLGYGFTPSFTLRLNVSGAQHDTSDPDTEFWISSGTIEALYLFRNPDPLRPYIFGGLGGFSMRSRRDELDFEVTGPGAVVGGGLVYFLGENFALDFAVRGDFINWEESTATYTFPNGTTATVAAPVEGEGSAAKFLFGAGWWF